jgi:hypothetical protein
MDVHAKVRIPRGGVEEESHPRPLFKHAFFPKPIWPVLVRNRAEKGRESKATAANKTATKKGNQSKLQILIFPSRPAEAIRLPSGLMATASTFFGWVPKVKTSRPVSHPRV